VDDAQILIRLTVALGIGLLIGLERGWKERGAHGGSRVAGVRTFALISVLGALWSMLADELGVVILGIAFLALAIVVVSAHVLSAMHDQDYGITTTVAALLTFALGAAMMRFEPMLVSGIAVLVATILGVKPILHRWVQALERQDLYAILQMLLISVVLLPVLPNRNMGSWLVLNPYELWLMVVLIAGVSFSGYFAIKVLGPRMGVGLTSAFGGLVSSTAVTLSFSRMGARSPELHRVLSAGVLFAAGTMFPRTLMLAAILNPAVAWKLLPAMVVMAVVCYAVAVWLWRTAPSEATIAHDAPRNPLELKSALGFGALLAVVMVLARWLREWLGDMGVYLLAALSGVTDVDAVTLSMSRMSQSDLPVVVASQAIMVAAVVNTAVKGGLALAIARSKMGWQVLGALLVVALLGALTGALLPESLAPFDFSTGNP